VKKLVQNGVSIGELIDLQIDEQGDVIANFSNGKSRKLYKVALAHFKDVNGLPPKSGTVFIVSNQSGDINLKEAGKEGAGTISSGVCESSNVDITEELAKSTIFLLRYQASAKLLNVHATMLDELIHKTFA